MYNLLPLIVPIPRTISQCLNFGALPGKLSSVLARRGLRLPAPLLQPLGGLQPLLGGGHPGLVPLLLALAAFRLLLDSSTAAVGEDAQRYRHAGGDPRRGGGCLNMTHAARGRVAAGMLLLRHPGLLLRVHGRRLAVRSLLLLPLVNPDVLVA